jgi:NADPH:quinone reductase-like Zn-dependent oxidoreductase
MQAAFYVKQGPAREVLQVGEQPTPEPGPGEVRVHLKTSGGESIRLEVSQRPHGADVSTTDHSRHEAAA